MFKKLFQQKKRRRNKSNTWYIEVSNRWRYSIMNLLFFFIYMIFVANQEEKVTGCIKIDNFICIY